MQSMLGQQFTLLDYIYNLESDERVSDADTAVQSIPGHHSHSTPE